MSFFTLESQEALEKQQKKETKKMGRFISSRNSREIRNKDGKVIVIVAGIATEVHGMRSSDTQKYFSISQSIKVSQNEEERTFVTYRAE